MAIQQKLGIWWKWLAWVSFASDNSWLAIRLPVISKGRIPSIDAKKIVCPVCAGPSIGACTLDTSVSIITGVPFVAKEFRY
jgi:hypothetical protein